MRKNYTIRIGLLVLILLSLKQEVKSQQVYELETLINLKEAKNFKHKLKHGIKVFNPNASSGWTVKVEVESKEVHDWTYGIGCSEEIFSEHIGLYGAQVTSNTAGQLVSNPLSGGSIYYRYKPGFFCWSERTSNSNDEHRLKRNAYLLHDKTTELIEIEVDKPGEILTKEVRLKVWKAPVTVKITLSGGVELSHIEEILIPGIKPISFENRISSINACHSSKGNNSKHCQAVRAIDSNQKASNDIFIAAHRGLWGDKAESSIGSVVDAENENWNIIEVDILRTKDDKLLLMHDQQINRLSEIGLTSNPTLEYTKGSPEENTSNKTWVRQLNYNTNTSGVPAVDGGTRTVSALKNLKMVNKWGEQVAGSDANLANFRDAAELFERLKTWDVIIALDIKDKDQNDYLFVTSQLLRLGIQKGVLDKLMFKPGSGVAGLEYSLFANYLMNLTENGKNLLDAFRNEVTVALILYSNVFENKDFLKFMLPWMSMPSLAVIETQYKNNEDFFFDASKDALFQTDAKLDGKTPIDWIIDMKYRTGTFWDNATDCRGVTDGRGHWFMPDEQSSTNQDYRGNLEWVINRNPGLIVTDRPDELKDYLQLFGLYAPLNKK